MTIVVTGGGSGGHIMPILAVAAELKKQHPSVKIIYIGQRGDKLADIPAADPHIDEVYAVRAGKFRRYHGEGFKQLLDLPTVFKNLRDGLYVLIGIIQSGLLIHRLQPSIIFTRGGFVSVPVAFGGLLNRVPYITHDSDSTPSLANRIIARWAAKHAVALPTDVYPYPAAKTVTVGIPIDAEYQPVTPEKQRAYRESLSISAKQVVLVTGGGNGAQQLNNAMVANARQLLAHHPQLAIIHITGRAHEADVVEAYKKVLPETAMHRVIIKDFITDLYRYSGAADVIIARGGATNLAEFAAQGKACVIVPSEQLAWTVKNMEVMGNRNAVRALTVAQSEQEGRLGAAVAELLDDDNARTELAANLASFAHPHAAKELAALILAEAKPEGS